MGEVSIYLYIEAEWSLYCFLDYVKFAAFQSQADELVDSAISCSACNSFHDGLIIIRFSFRVSCSWSESACGAAATNCNGFMGTFVNSCPITLVTHPPTVAPWIINFIFWISTEKWAKMYCSHLCHNSLQCDWALHGILPHFNHFSWVHSWFYCLELSNKNEHLFICWDCSSGCWDTKVQS